MDNSFYYTAKWKRLRASILRRDGYQCQLSKRYGKTVPAEVVHHIFPREQYPQYQWAPWNLISISKEEHNSLHDRVTDKLTEKGMELLKRTAEKQRLGVVQTFTKVLVIGLAGTGKTTYVKDHITDKTLVYDLDAIASAFRLKAPHEEYHAGARKMANDLLLGFVNNASEYCETVYIIRTAPSIDELEARSPDKVVVCSHQYVQRQSDDDAPYRIQQIVSYCTEHRIKIFNPPV